MAKKTASVSLPEQVHKLCKAMNESLSLSALLQQLADAASSLTGSDSAELVIEESLLRFALRDDTARVRRMREDDALTRWIIDNNEALIVPDLSYASSESELLLKDRNIESFVGVPLRFEDMVQGALYILNKESRSYDQGELQTLETLATLGALSLSRHNLLRRIEDNQRTLIRFALTDPLTNLATQRHFDFMLKREWQRMEAELMPLSLLQLELDSFKMSDARIGPQSEREVLYAVSQVLNQKLHRPSDLPARLGQGHFTVLLPDTDRKGAFALATRLLEDVAELKLKHPQREGQVTISIGLSTFQPLEPKLRFASQDELLSASRLALEEALQSGGNKIIVRD